LDGFFNENDWRGTYRIVRSGFWNRWMPKEDAHF
jgi:hypothetical protein